MTAFRPISPHAALQILADADIGVDKERLLADLTMAGVVKSYARLIESEASATEHTEVRDSRIDRSLWRRIIAEQKIGHVYQDGSVHLDSQREVARVSVIGIRFDAVSVNAAAAAHGAVPPPPAIAEAAKPAAPPAAAEVPPLAEVTADPVLPDLEKRRGRLDPGTVALSVKETAEVLGVAPGTVYSLIKRGELTAKKVGTRTLVQADSIRTFMA